MKKWDELKAEHLMKGPIQTVDVRDTLEETAKTLSRRRISGALVLDSRGEAIGTISLFDIVSYMAGLPRPEDEPGGFYRFCYPKVEEDGSESWQETTPSPLRQALVREVMTPDIISVPPDTPVREVAKELARRRIHRVFVSRGEIPVGVISTLDILESLEWMPVLTDQRR